MVKTLTNPRHWRTEGIEGRGRRQAFQAYWPLGSMWVGGGADISGGLGCPCAVDKETKASEVILQVCPQGPGKEWFLSMET